MRDHIKPTAIDRNHARRFGLSFGKRGSVHKKRVRMIFIHVIADHFGVRRHRVNI